MGWNASNTRPELPTKKSHNLSRKINRKPGYGWIAHIPVVQLWILVAEPVVPEGLVNWPKQDLQQLPLEPGQEYTASLWAKADEPRPFAMQFKSLDNSTTWSNTPVDLTTEWAEYSMTAEALSNNTVSP